MVAANGQTNGRQNGISLPVSDSPIPIVDFAAWTPHSTAEEKLSIARSLVTACRDVGFVYIVNHGVPQELLDQAFTITQKLFDLPMEDKMKAPHPPTWAHHRGYSWPGLEKVSGLKSDSSNDDRDAVAKLRQISDCKESYEIGNEENTNQPNIWLPDEVLPGFREFMVEFHEALFDAAKKLYSAMAIGLGLDEDHLLKLHSSKWNQLRLLHYPPIPAKLLQEEKFARMPAHTDWGSLTMLFQDDCGGLEIEDPKRTGQFIAATPVKGAMILNIGDLMQRWSNDYLKSTLHRVSLPPLQDRYSGEEQMTRTRYSIPYFMTTDPDLLIETMPSELCVNSNRPPKYEPITQRQYSASRAKMQY